MGFTYLANRSECKCNCILYPPLWCIVAAMSNAYNSIEYALRVSGHNGEIFSSKISQFLTVGIVFVSFRKIHFRERKQNTKENVREISHFFRESFRSLETLIALRPESLHFIWCTVYAEYHFIRNYDREWLNWLKLPNSLLIILNKFESF